MMQKIRDHANGPFAKILFGLIILSFGGWGATSYFDGGAASNASVAGKVNGQEVSRYEVDQIFTSLLRAQAGRELTEKETQTLKTLAFERAAMRLILNQTTQSLRLAAGNREMAQMIKNNPEFQTSGKFDRALYDQFLSQNKLTPEQYESSIAAEIALQHLLKGIEISSGNSQKILADLIANQFSKRDVQVAQFDFKAAFEKTSVSDAELKQYFAENSNQYRQAERVKLNYVEVSNESVRNTLAVSDAEVEDYFNTNKTQYEKPERREATQLMIGLTKDVNSKQAIQKLNEYRKEIQSGELSFDKAIEKLNKDSSVQATTGSLGELTKGTIGDDVLDQALFSTKEGELSEVVESALGVHLLKVVKIVQKNDQSLKSVKNQIIEKIKEIKAEQSFLEKQDEFQKLLETTPNDLASVAKGLGQEVLESDWESIKNPTGLLKQSDILLAVVSDELMNKGLVSPPIAIGQNKAIAIKILKHEPERASEFDEVSHDIDALLRNKKALALIREKAKALQTEIEKNPEQFKVLAEKTDAKFSSFTALEYTQIEKYPTIQFSLQSALITAKPEADKAKILFVDNSSSVMDLGESQISIVSIQNVIDGKLSDVDANTLDTLNSEINALLSGAQTRAYLESIKKKSNIVENADAP